MLLFFIYYFDLFLPSSPCNKLIIKQIVAKVNETKCFSILADETTDILNIEHSVLDMLIQTTD
jgi:hypothetical protein